ncbi:MAG: HlyD family efflux transporter periplasmic adaptor subunit [Bacteroidales bacterium]|nr:HlyD family efflux transporter periplasmic adaptor subunit [Bacteroidales bacterium]
MKTTITLIIFAGIILSTSCNKNGKEISPERKNITETVFASGVLVPESQYNLTSLTEGYITQLNFDEGSLVKTGELLAVINNKQNTVNALSADNLYRIALQDAQPDAPSLKQAKTNLELAEKKLESDKKQAERYKKLYELKSVSKLEYENIMLAYESSKTNYETAKENYRFLKQQADRQLIIQKTQKNINTILESYNKIKAVIGGKIYKKNKEIGDYVRKGDIIAVIGDPYKLYALLNVDESNISKIKLNQKVVIELNTNKGKTYNAKITEIYPAFDEKTQSFYCKAEFTDSLDFKISGTQLQSNIIIQNKKNILVIPRNYLGYGNKVILKDSGEITVKTGFISNNWAEITEGLNENSVLLPANSK